MLISIADCNFGQYNIDIDEANRISQERGINIDVVYQNCSQNNIVEKCRGSDVLAVQRLYVDGDLVDQIPGLKLVVRLGTGIDNVCLPDMESRNIPVLYFPGCWNEEVANHATAMILSMYRNLTSIDRLMSLNSWGKPESLYEVRQAQDTTIGILGYGRIGSAVAKRMKCCGFNVIAHDPYVFDFDDAQSCEMNELFESSDILSIHCPLTEETHGMVDQFLLARMKRNSMLVNTARGDIVNKNDLIHALKTGILKSAYVDVWEPEPPDAQEICDIHNLYITPHIAYYSQEALERLKRRFIRESVDICESQK